MSQRIWETADEIAYLKSLGQEGGSKARLVHLRNYRDILMPRRNNWGDIDRAIVRCYLDMEIGSSPASKK